MLEIPLAIVNTPTLPQWGLIALPLLLLTAGTIVIGRRQVAMAGTEGSLAQLSRSLGSPLFVRDLFLKTLAGTLALAIAGLAVAIWLFGSVSSLDLAGTLVCAVIVAYIAHLWIVTVRD